MAQVITSIILFACIILLGAVHSIAGNITGFGYVILGIFLLLGYVICRTAWQEYKEDKQ